MLVAFSSFLAFFLFVFYSTEVSPITSQTVRTLHHHVDTALKFIQSAQTGHYTADLFITVNLTVKQTDLAGHRVFCSRVSGCLTWPGFVTIFLRHSWLGICRITC